MKPIALITGATAGIGHATALTLAKSHRLVLCGRRKERLNELEEELKDQTQTKTLVFDIRKKEAVFTAIESLDAEWQQITVLINNAGNAHGLAPFDAANLADLEAMIDGNIKGMIYVSKAVIPLMKKQGKGHIVNVSSTAGKQVYAKGAVYCASKSAVEALSKGLRLDLVQYGIKITNIAPGAVETEFSLVRFKGNKEKAEEVYAGYKALEAKDIAAGIQYAILQPEHVQIADLTITPKAQADTTTFFKG